MYRQQRKVLVRLEQSISAAMQRSLTKRKALAILYGQHLRYYMTKTEVWSDSSCLLEFHIQDVSVHFIFKHHITASNLNLYYRLLILQWFYDLFVNLLISQSAFCSQLPVPALVELHDSGVCHASQSHTLNVDQIHDVYVVFWEALLRPVEFQLPPPILWRW